MVEAVHAVLNYAFNELNFALVSVYHYTFNTQSASVIKQAGFKYEGIQRQSAQRFDGYVVDSALYSLTKDIISTPCWPRIGPKGGAGVAEPA